ncbi:phosphatidate cytidylyltransferase [Rubeoparvulum massiliense]|uniref:phosphatidate cytidylyltransferase n=1 Tax=Rubeoparvulum massiliense TaxID=1631346 RepID=UPI00065DF9D4|nr:phosphatidate cytidylyltransferase [Rubeoparvulum massiliense]
MLRQRVLTGIVGAIIYLSFLYLGGDWYTGLLFLLASIGFFEYARMKQVTLWSLEGLVGLFLTWYNFSPVAWRELLPFPLDTEKVLLGAILLWMLIMVLKKNQVHIDTVSYLFFGTIYIGFGFHYIAEARYLIDGFLITVMVILTIWASDIFAYFVGRAWGKHKLWPAISPKKTIEGSVGGMAGSVVILMAVVAITPISMTIVQQIALGLLISISGQLGDLMESALKRHVGVKDSGRLLPGHGGILDRCDSWLVAFPVLFLFQLL